MEITPFERVGLFSFKNDYKTIKNNIKTSFSEDVEEEIEKKYPRIYIEDLDLMINFEEDAKSVRFFEFFKNARNVKFKGIDLISEPYSKILEEISKKDSNITIEKYSLESEKFGLTISREIDSSIVESVLIGSKSYFSEQEIDLNDLYKSIMGKDYPE